MRTVEELDGEVTDLALAGHKIEAVKLRMYYTGETLKQAWEEVQRRINEAPAHNHT